MAPRSLSVRSTTWTRELHSLFDYESSSTKSELFDVIEPVTCARLREGDSVVMMPSGLPYVRVEELCRLGQDATGAFVIEPAEIARRPWLVVRDLPHRQVLLTEGDVIKFGRFQFLVRALVTDTTCVRDLPEASIASCIWPTDAVSKMCRICLEPGEDDLNAEPLIAPCRCRGSVECVHVSCLKTWIHSKMNVVPGSDSFQFRSPPTCELCKADLPTEVKDMSGLQPLLPQPKPPYIILQGQGRDARDQPLHVLSMAGGEPLRVGRSRCNSLHINDTSLSRLHALIHFEHGAFVLEDNHSKFGTLIAMRDRHRVDVGTSCSIQAGRTLLTLSVPCAERSSDDQS